MSARGRHRRRRARRLRRVRDACATAGLEPGEIVVFGDDADPAGAWRPRAAAIRQRRMRSESDGHCFPTTFPGLAAREAARRRDLAPLVLSVCDRYRPTVGEFPPPRRRAARAQPLGRERRLGRIERIAAVDGGFELDGHGVFRHVLLATGPSRSRRPGRARGRPARRPRLRAARVRLAGRGGRRRHGGGDRVAERARSGRRGRLRPPPRACAPAAQRRRGRSSRSAASPGSTPRRARERGELLAASREPSYPPGRSWDDADRARGARGPLPRGGGVNGAEQVICATGFRRGFEHDPLLRAARRRARARDARAAGSCSPTTRPCPALTDATRTLALAGVPAQWAYPAADTLVGMKYAARRFLRRVGRVVHAERPPRDAARARAPALPRRVRVLAPSCASGGRSRSSA